jgi:hypothetical protein
MACVKEGKGNNTLFTPPRPTTRQQPAAMDDRLPKQHEEAVALSGAPSAAAPPSLNDLLADNAAAAKAFDAPMSLGVKRKVRGWRARRRQHACSPAARTQGSRRDALCVPHSTVCARAARAAGCCDVHGLAPAAGQDAAQPAHR